MRITNQLQARTLIFNTQRSLAALLVTQNQVSTGKRVQRPSDDTVAATLAMRFQNGLSAIERYKSVLSTGLSRLSATDTALADAYQKLLDAQQIAITELDGAATTESRAAAGQVVADIISSLLSTSANFKFEGRYLFAGSLTKTAPFVEAGGGIVYLGNEASLLGNVADGATAALNMTGQEAFGALSSEVAGTVDLNPGVTLGSGSVPPTSLADLNQGRGVAKGSIAITVGTTTTNIDLSGAEDLDDVRDLIQAAVPAITVSVNGSGNGLTLTHSSSSFTVSEVSGGTTAADLGIDGASTGMVLTGSDIDPRLSLDTPVSVLNGTGLTLTGVTVTNGTLGPVDIDLSTAVTMEDVIQAIENARTSAGDSLYLEATITDTGLNVRSRLSGTFLKIAETGAGTTAADLGILTRMTGATPLYTLNGGAGFTGGPVEIVYSGGTVEVDLTTAETVEDIQDAISEATNGVVTMSILAGPDRFRLTDSGGGANPTLNVPSGGTAETITDLGFAVGTPGAGGVLTGSDVDSQGVRAENLFTALLDLKNGLLSDNTSQIERALALLETAIGDLNTVRGELGGRISKLEGIQARHDANSLTLSELLSKQVDVDAIEAVSRLAQQQAAYEAALQVSATISQLSLAFFLR